MVDEGRNLIMSFRSCTTRWLPNLGSKVPIEVIEHHDWARLHVSLCG